MICFSLVHETKESAAYISTNFTTKPNTPGRFIVWFRNETTLLVLWQPPYPAGVYTEYKVSIDPPDAEQSETYVAKDGEPPGTFIKIFKSVNPVFNFQSKISKINTLSIYVDTLFYKIQLISDHFTTNSRLISNRNKNQNEISYNLLLS